MLHYNIVSFMILAMLYYVLTPKQHLHTFQTPITDPNNSTDICIFVCIHVCMYSDKHAMCMYVYVYVCMYVCTACIMLAS